MGNPLPILNKLSRNLDQRGITHTRASNGNITVQNGSNNLTISYVQPDIQAPMGGVDGNVSPFLGIGTGNPGVLRLKFQATSIAACLDTATVIRAFAVCAALANDLIIEDSATTPNQVRIRGTNDWVALGQ
jgi:hypothetical protein